MGKSLAAAAFLCAGLATPFHVGALALGQVDTFEDGTTSGWIVGLLGASHPAPPVVVPTGGPNEADDAYLRLTAVGGAGAGSRLSVLNGAQWAGNYIGLGIGTIELDLLNLGPSDLSIRLMFENPLGAPPTDVAVSSAAALLVTGGGWTHVSFAIDPTLFTALLGNATSALTTATFLRIIHAEDVGLAEPLVASLGVDNIRAGPPAPPRPASEPSMRWLTLVAALASSAAVRRRSVASRTRN